MDHTEEQLRLRLAGFLIQALSLDEDAAPLATEITPLKRDVNAGISTVELTSSVGDVAFLLYHYTLSQPNEQGQTGRTLFETDLATLEQAATRDVPGPRLMAHATTDTEAYILATTPAAHRALTGQAPLDEVTDLEAKPAHLPLGADLDETRRTAAGELLRLLRDANTQATTWLAAIEASEQSQESGTVPFTEEETALTLFLLDERNVQNLLQTLNRLIRIAKERSASAFDGESDA
ncbi:MAG TPA: hypothetical protein VFL82_11960 [Thermomicrobiales bacterium]|nr:hypothetical protein [Thermomicrobiales bacterium]